MWLHLRRMIFNKSQIVVPEDSISPSRPFYSFERNGVTSSLLQEFLACKERARLSYVEGWSSSQQSNALTFGSHIHSILEEIYKEFKLGVKLEQIKINRVVDKVLQHFRQNFTGIWSTQNAEDHLLNEGYLKILIPEYLKIYYKRDQKYTLNIVEEEFNNVYEKDVLLRGKWDRIITNKAGETWVLDIKSKSRIDPEIQTRLSFDPQMMMYILNYQLKFKIRPAGFIYDIVLRPALRKGKNENLKHFMDRVKSDVDETYFKRIQMRLDGEEFIRWKTEFSKMISEFRSWIKSRMPTYRNPAACETRYGNCQFLKVCGLGDYVGLRRRERPMMELSPL